LQRLLLDSKFGGGHRGLLLFLFLFILNTINEKM
jgi:hypothetical protein